MSLAAICCLVVYLCRCNNISIYAYKGEALNNTTNYPMVPMRGLVIFPHMVLSFEVGRDSSIASVEEAVERDSLLFLVTQRDVETEEPGIDDVHDVGVLSRVKQVMRMPDGELRLIVEGISRACLIDMVANDNQKSSLLML